MITEEMLDIYARFNGDMDGFARVGSARDRALMSETQWYALDAFVLELHAVKAQLASPGYAEQIESRLSAMSANPRVRERLWQLA
ncbi:MAG: hypothetical protein KBF63_09605 [Rhodoferax sp.]|nr:hypothetical protein [Rhodoferax sp.]MBP9929519.1 hypothetical protein [Rhodoferax sp.]HQX59221.1 hypothetical protein [Burkholderiaceae bacterium]HQZ05870.1 hypothetical protein [Burkholderiaceae bacterium]